MEDNVKRVGQVIRLKSKHYAEYARIHAGGWPEVLATIYRASIRNYSIYHWNGTLFAYFEVVGNDFEADMVSIAADPNTRESWQLPGAMQSPVRGSSSGSLECCQWTPIEERFHTD